MADIPLDLTRREGFNSNDTDALLIVIGVLDEELPTHTSGERIAMAARIVACLSEVHLIPGD